MKEKMRELFGGYYRPTPDEFVRMWREGIFVFDTNVLLHIYRYSPNTRNDLFGLWEKLRARIWIPHQVILEYFENREDVIAQQYSLLSEVEKSLDKVLVDISNKYKRGHPFADIKAIEQIFEKTKTEIKDALLKAQANSHNLQEHDILLERITQLFDDKIGAPYSEEQLAEMHKKLDARFQRCVPPGYKDAKKETAKQNDEELKVNKYGDGVLWFQMIEYAKLQKKPIIFITDDVKEDWWRRSSGKMLGPRPELVKEMYTETSISFYMYTADTFIKRAQEFLDVQVQPATVEEVREFRQQDEAMQREAPVLNSGYYPIDNQLRAIQQSIESVRRIEDFSDSPAQARMIKQVQEIARTINKVGGMALVRQIEDARRSLQFYNSSGRSGSFTPSSISDEMDTETLDTIDNEKDEDSSSDEH